jgi:putative DNA primase/helicase
MTEFVEALEERSRQIKEALLEYGYGGPDRIEECRSLGAGFDWLEKAIEHAQRLRKQWEKNEAWKKRERVEAEKRKAELEAERAEWQAELARQAAERKEKEAALFIYPDAQPPIANEAEAQPSAQEPIAPSIVPGASPGASIRDRLNQIGKEKAAAAASAELTGLRLLGPKPKPEDDEGEEPAEDAPPDEAAEASPGDLGNFANDDEEHPDEVAVLNPAASYDNAREYARRYCWREGFLATYYWHEEFWQWNGRTYEKMSAEDLRPSVYKFLDASLKLDGKAGEYQRVRFRPKPEHTNALIDGLKAGLAVPNDWYPPVWLDTKQKASTVWVFANGVLDIETDQFRKPSPRLWVHGAVDFNWNPKAECPVWDKYREEVFPGDQESQDFLEEYLGYCKTEDTRFQKGALFIGDARSGKGTYLDLKEAFLGSTRVVGLSFNNWMKDDKSRENLLGKTAGVFPDVRLRPGKWYGASYDPGGLDHASVEEMLKLTAGDKVTIPRKYIKAYEGKLPIKMTLVSNVVPNFNDPVLPTRFVKLAWEQSFLDREDMTLPARLKAELPGIARRALEGYRRACNRGRFIQPKSGLNLKQSIEDEANPFWKFVRETFVIDPAGTVMISVFELRWQLWCGKNGRQDLLKSIKKQTYLKHLRQIPGLAAIKTVKPHGQPRVYTMLRLRRADEKVEN